MKNRCYPRHYPFVNAGILLAFLFAIPALRADLTSGQPAQSVLGKPDFTNTTANAPTATQLNSPGGLAIDAVTKKLFVADPGNHRVLRFATAASYLTGAAAEAVFGQADFVSGSANRGGAVGANTLDGPRSLHVDAAGRLWVADSSNNRILRFDGAASKASGVNADAILGQANSISKLASLSQSGMNLPLGVATDASGNLYVADCNNSRVLVFNNAAAKGNGANADRVLGQATFGTNSTGTSATKFFFPGGLVIDAAGRLWVADTSNSRLLRFDNAATIASGAAAVAVLGQANFTTQAAQAVSATSLNFPSVVAAAPDGTLWVGDFGYERVLGYRNAAAKSNGGGADVVLGQANFVTDGAGGAASNTIGSVNGVAMDSEGGLFVSDPTYHRVLRFSAAVVIKSPSRVTAKGGKARLRGTSEHASLIRYKQPGAPFANASGGVSSWQVKVKGLSRPISRVRVMAVALDQRAAKKTVKVIQR